MEKKSWLIAHEDLKGAIVFRGSGYFWLVIPEKQA